MIIAIGRGPPAYAVGRYASLSLPHNDIERRDNAFHGVYPHFGSEGYPVARFIAGSDLADAIRDVLGGNNVRCAVAFWGTGAEALLDQATGDQPRIICDVTLGGTSPNALRALGAPENDRLRYVPSLHAKVYISDRGAIVGSANASQNGVGQMDLRA